MKVLKVLFAILIVLLLIVASTIVLNYQVLHYSLLSAEENSNALNDAKAQAETIELFIENNDVTKNLNLPQMFNEQNVAAFNSTELGEFIKSAVKNSLDYLFLKSDKVEPFDKTFITSFKNNTIEMTIDGLLKSDNSQLLLQNLDKVDKETFKKGLAESFDEIKITYTAAELDGIANNLYDGEPSQEKLKDELTTFISNKINIKFNPETLVEKSLKTPRLINQKVDYIFGQLLLIEVILLIVLLAVVLLSRNGLFICLLITAIFSVGLLQILRIIRIGSFVSDLPEKGLVLHYYDHMSGLLIKNINCISIAVFAFLLIFLIINLIINKASNKSDTTAANRYRPARIVVSLVIIVAISFVGFQIYQEVQTVKHTIQSFNIEKELENLNDMFEMDLKL
ncbi:MAG: hypothetical protein CR995_00045 [Clostridiales bacterium]|nr:MAG: hypothetical protein CR995_00045 [Clostridiales bacterium]